MLSLRLHKERYEFQCDRSYNQQDMTKKNTPVKSLVWESSFFFCPTTKGTERSVRIREVNMITSLLRPQCSVSKIKLKTQCLVNF